ncbi:MAG: RsmE family RNA methyltransferase [Cytophagales bacterium]
MSINYFYKPDLDSTFLSKEESHYASRVLRIKNGDIIHAFDGIGHLQVLECKNSKSDKMEVSIVESKKIERLRKHKIHIAIAPTKKIDRVEWFLEKSVEIGIDKISFIKSRHSIRNVIKEERIDKTILSAARQSGNFVLPEWSPIEPLESFIHKNLHIEEKYIAHLDNSNPSEQKNFEDIHKNKNEYLILVGPEGDFSSEEINLVKEVGFKSLSLGQSRLRTETAGIVSCLYLNLI